MDNLHETLASLRPETKAKDHLTVFREFLAQLDQLQRDAQTSRVKPPRKRIERREREQ
jgi:hypothetical protein